MFAIGGGNTLIPEFHRVAVDAMHWMNDRQFADLFAISRVSPGPNIIIVTLIGYHVAGLAGALVATAAMVLPTCTLTYVVARLWERFKHTRWRMATEAGLVPVALGLIAASALVIARASDHSVAAAVLTLATAGVAYATRINPLWLFAVAAAAGAAGLV
ncbi:MAG: chromate transporter [Pseudolabrys sp.]